MNYYFDVICVHASGAKQFFYYTSLLKNSIYDIVIYILGCIYDVRNIHIICFSFQSYVNMYEIFRLCFDYVH